MAKARILIFPRGLVQGGFGTTPPTSEDCGGPPVSKGLLVSVTVLVEVLSSGDMLASDPRETQGTTTLNFMATPCRAVKQSKAKPNETKLFGCLRYLITAATGILKRGHILMERQ